MKRTNFFLILIIILSIALRIFYLGKIPNGFYSDEAAYGYNAYSILKTAKDEYGQFLPIAFKSFGDYKAPLYIYFLVPFVWLFCLTEISVRLSSVVLGIATIVLTFYLAEELFKNPRVALLASFLVSVSPFSLQFNRMAHENNLVVFLVLLGVLFFVKSFNKPNFIFFSAISFVLSIYTYHDARVFTPIFVLCMLIIYRKKLVSFKRNIVISLFLSLVLLIPFFNLLKSDAFWSRPKFTILSSDPGISLRINDERGEDINGIYLWPTLFHNKIISYFSTFIDNYMKHYSFDFLYQSGDPVKIYQTLDNGLEYLSLFPFLVLGLYFLFRENLNHKWFILSWLILPPIPSALTRFVPSASRILSLLPVLSILSTFGIIFCIKIFSNQSKKFIFTVIFSAIFILNTSYYLHFYYINTPIRYAKEWHYGMKEVIGDVTKIQNKYSRVWFSKSAWGYIYALFYMKYPPDLYQTQSRLSALNEFGFGWIDSFGKYTFADIPDKQHRSSDVLYIGNADDFPDIKKPLYSVYYPDGHAAFYLTDTDSF